MKKLLLILLATYLSGFSQKKEIKIISSDFSKVDEKKFPDVIFLEGNVKIAHEGATLDCKRGLLYKKENLFKAVGEVIMEQGDSIIQYSNFVNYYGDTKIAKSWGNVEVHDKEMKLSTDTLYFDRTKQILYYPNNGKIFDNKNTLRSKKGTYYSKDKKFVARSSVTVNTPDNLIESNQLDYYTDTNLAYLYGASTITNLKDSTKIYSERGFYDTNKDISYFVKNTKLFLKDRTIHADSMYYDKRKGFASATNRIKVIDTLNNMITKGNYAELFEKRDSLFIVNRAVGITVKDKDSMYVHGDTIMVTGKTGQRIVRTFHNVKLFKSNLQGKCDSIYTSQVSGLTKMYKDPVLWSKRSQITGDSIQLLTNTKTEKLDSLFIYRNSFMVEKDTIDNKIFNQIQGRNMFGNFENGEIRTLLVKGNAESLYYNRNEKNLRLETITSEIASNIEFTLQDSQINETKYTGKPKGKTYPPSKFPEDKNRLKGYIWRENERPLTKEAIFINDKTPLPKKEEKTKKVKNKNKAIEKAKLNFSKESKKKAELDSKKLPNGMSIK